MSTVTDDFIELSEDGVLALTGPNERYLALIEAAYNVLVETPGGGLSVTGDVAGRQKAKAIFGALKKRFDKGLDISEADVRLLIQNPLGKTPAWADHHSNSHVVVMGRKGAVVPKTEGQAGYFQQLLTKSLVFGLGPAGSGKTFLAVAHGTQLLMKGAVDRLVIARPAVEAGEKLGFLPGDLNEKVDPYMMPIWQALDDILGADGLRKRRERNEIEVAPLAYMRGRTLSNAYVIIDEAQNTTKQQMKMVLTRLGEGSKMVVTGDPSQVDLPNARESGLAHAVSLLGRLEGVGVSRLTADDVVRHELVARIVRAYDNEFKES
ncbi:PhoH family protein [Asticcacaulis endophyticus]|uniref:PhoH-like protein n=1 Tax=Asticcacaulis endophyticus TaxID=1395890 RepID=A0A918PWU4_9CAUL|nr:PhoH family protein [Asticcacaulis endophyticus]GGZ24602.1 phosphate starvation protein PhoH [Asticcacaulis endophyticus]